ncbi:hypothetical protein HMPREF1487_04954 [Pseudomonas sp. HPB0071]|uniref:Uncharacterized protein n=2 Tax=Pseudomonas TaxID=286 RepID=A0A2X2E7A7_PSELU|nr:hypothetical protein HMPREF1487_04954 [Pseudomonas sp. HPB0071]SEQ33834.1 hypothetical protein SAMN05216409_10585 [Pseudomonas lutea]SHI35915.1 hypothetical protein SAMN05216295_101373 [Pseudomonas zeshuii]SPZ03989.1 Uncharacterised protein [Pseudomonas luteola]
MVLTLPALHKPSSGKAFPNNALFATLRFWPVYRFHHQETLNVCYTTAS